jgi:hypothetical protein
MSLELASVVHDRSASPGGEDDVSKVTIETQNRMSQILNTDRQGARRSA